MNKPEILSIKPRSPFKARYENFIGSQWVPPVSGRYLGNISPINGEVVCEVPRSNAEDVELALDAAPKARSNWLRSSSTERARLPLSAATSSPASDAKPTR